MRKLSSVAMVVPEYDVGIAFFVGVLGFHLVADEDLGGGKRWVLVAAEADAETRILLARADGDAQEAAIGNQTGGRVGWFLETDDFVRDHAFYSAWDHTSA